MNFSKTRSTCKECPWTNKNSHSESWQYYAKKMTEVGYVENLKHACHMITVDVWGINEPITDKNVCIGACTNQQK